MQIIIKKQITKEHLSHYLCMWWNCGSELEVNFRMVYILVYGQTQNFTKRASRKNNKKVSQSDYTAAVILWHGNFSINAQKQLSVSWLCHLWSHLIYTSPARISKSLKYTNLFVLHSHGKSSSNDSVFTQDVSGL